MVLAYWEYKRFKFWPFQYIYTYIYSWGWNCGLQVLYCSPSMDLTNLHGPWSSLLENWTETYITEAFTAAFLPYTFFAHMWPSTGKAGQRHRKTKKTSIVHINKQVMTESRTRGHSTISCVCCLNFVVCKYSPNSKGNLTGCVKSIKVVHLSKQHLKNVIYGIFSGA